MLSIKFCAYLVKGEGVAVSRQGSAADRHSVPDATLQVIAEDKPHTDTYNLTPYKNELYTTQLYISQL